MTASSFRCPHCATPLRVRDRKFIGRQIACPDCRQPIEIIADGPRSLAAQPVARAEAPAQRTWRQRVGVYLPRRGAATGRDAQNAVPAETSDAGSPEHGGQRGRLARFGAVIASPIGVAWTLASAITLGLVVLIWPAGESPAGASRDRDARGRSGAQPEGTVGGPNGNAHPAADADAPPAVDNPVRDRLTQLAGRLESYRKEHGHFPSGTVPQPHLAPVDRFSWLVTLAVESDPGGAEPLWDQSWHDPLNDRFSRRAAPDLLNPAVGEQVGPNRFPATHFVGMGGVGPDAPELPVDHPRAGAFGHDRQTRIEDIRDGAANTMIVAGVQERISGWAGGGPGTVRPLTREPYVNGPDGFGTGQPDSMLVLMADGSVRTISRDTSPVIVRRMAAIADGLPLDEDAPGEPGEPASGRESPAPADEPIAAGEAGGVPADAPEDPAGEVAGGPPALDDGPPEVPVGPPAPPEPSIDFTAALAQQIDLYDVPKPAAVRLLLREIEEMLGAPLELDGETPRLEARLDEAVSLRLEQTTLGRILDEVTRRAGLSYSIGPRAITLRVAADEPDAAEPVSTDGAARP